MARIKLGPMITNISGSVGGVTIQRNRFGTSMRNKPLPLYSQTPAQFDIRRKIASLQTSWQALTDADRLQWDRFLNFSGQTIRRDHSVLLSGQALYIKYQLYRLMSGLALLTTIEYSPMPDHFDLQNLEVDIGPTLALIFTGVVDSTKYFFICKLTNPRLYSQFYSLRGLRFMEVSFGSDNEYFVTTPYLSAFGAIPTAGQWLHYSLLFFSVTAPVYTAYFTGKTEVV